MASIEKHGDKYRVVQWIDGKRKYSTQATHADALIEKTFLERKKHIGHAVAVPSKDTVEAVVNHYIAKDGKWGRNKSYELEAIKRDIGHVAIAKLTHTYICDYIVGLDKPPVSSNNRLSYLSSVLKHARAKMRLSGVAQKDEVQAAREELADGDVIGSSEHRERRTNQDEIDQLRGVSEESAVCLPEILSVLSVVPIRLGELLKIKWKGDVDYVNRRVLLRERKDPDRKKKEKKNQWIPLPTLDIDGAIVDTFALVVTNRQQRFGQQDGPFPYQSQQISDAMKNARIAAGVNFENLDDRLRVHDLRAYAITQMLKAKINPFTIMAVSGHTETKTFFKHYVRLDVADVAKQWEEGMSLKASQEAKIAALEAQLAALQPRLKRVA